MGRGVCCKWGCRPAWEVAKAKFTGLGQSFLFWQRTESCLPPRPAGWKLLSKVSPGSITPDLDGSEIGGAATAAAIWCLPANVPHSRPGIGGPRAAQCWIFPGSTGAGRTDPAAAAATVPRVSERGRAGGRHGKREGSGRGPGRPGVPYSLTVLGLRAAGASLRQAAGKRGAGARWRQ